MGAVSLLALRSKRFEEGSDAIALRGVLPERRGERRMGGGRAVAPQGKAQIPRARAPTGAAPRPWSSSRTGPRRERPFASAPRAGGRGTRRRPPCVPPRLPPRLGPPGRRARPPRRSLARVSRSGIWGGNRSRPPMRAAPRSCTSRATPRSNGRGVGWRRLRARWRARGARAHSRPPRRRLRGGRGSPRPAPSRGRSRDRKARRGIRSSRSP